MAVAVISSAALPRKRLSAFQQAMLSLYWFSTSLHWTAILIIALPSQAAFIAGDEFKGRGLGLILAVGALVSMIAAPFLGALSDRIRTRWGRRVPFIVVGVAMNVLGLIGLAYIPRAGDLSSLWPYIIAFMWVEFWNNFASAPYSALIPDMVPPEQRGSASGWMGLMTMFGNFVGGLAGLLLGLIGGIVGLYWVIIAAMILGAAGTVLFVKEPPAPEPKPFNYRNLLGVMAVFGFAAVGSIILNALALVRVAASEPLAQLFGTVACSEGSTQLCLDVSPALAVGLTVGSLPLGLILVWAVTRAAGQWQRIWSGTREWMRQYNDFVWVFLTRFLITMGVYTVQEFLLFYLRDAVGDFRLFGMQVAETAESAVSFFLITLLLGAIASTLVAGILSDKFGRKLMVYISGALQGVVALIFILFHDFTLAVLMGIVFGLGFGAYQSVDWALASDVLPSEDYAKDMGVWHVSQVLPQMLATPFAGFFLDAFQKIGKTPAVNQPTLGYTVIFLMSVVYFVLGTVFVTRIKKVR
ncbi:MAG: MFS transporter [Chloroflexi bacterium]|nr:MFS transporter [Chloroflexota bacterium]